MAFSYSTDEESYTGDFASYEDAARAGFHEADEDDERDSPLKEIHVGENRRPDPTAQIDGEDVMTQLVESNEESYCQEWCGDWPGATPEQYKELSAMLGKALGDWMDKHDLRPTFYNVENVKKFTREEVMK